jgi:hypothetical protein
MEILRNNLKARALHETNVSAGMYTAQAQKQAPTCAICGQKLGVGFYFTCHTCGNRFCYAHIPVKCTHETPPVGRRAVLQKIKR